MTDIVPAQTQKLTIHRLYQYPDHGPRGEAFEKAKERMKALGLDKCVVPDCDTGAPIEYHHTWVENAMQNGIDVSKLDVIAGLHLTDAEFTDWVQSPGNLEPLCSVHHRTQLGVHHIPEPDWNALRAWQNGKPPPVEYVVSANDKLASTVHAFLLRPVLMTKHSRVWGFARRWNTKLARW